MNVQETIFWQHRNDLLRILTVLWRMGGLSHQKIIKRSLHRIVTRLLRPAEAAVRRLIVVLGTGIVVTLRPSRSGASRAADQPQSAQPNADETSRQAAWTDFVLTDPTLQWPELGDEPRPFPGILACEDKEIDATRLAMRLDALCYALDDLNRQAKRLARWTALRRRAREYGKFCTTQPLRPGPPLDLRGQCGRKLKKHELYHILKDTHERAWWAQNRPRDTS